MSTLANVLRDRFVDAQNTLLHRWKGFYSGSSFTGYLREALRAHQEELFRIFRCLAAPWPGHTP
jgi:hypothetical protein